MKRINLQVFALTTIMLALSACNGLQKMHDNAEGITYNVSPNPLELVGTEVDVTVETKFPPKYFNKKAIIEATPVIVYEGGEKAYEATTVQGESVEANNKVISFEGGNFTYTGSVPYAEGMMNASLEMRMTGTVGDNVIEFPGIKIADGVVITQTLVQNTPEVIIAPDKFERIVPETYEAKINYIINRADVRNSELKEDDIKSFEESISSASEAGNKEFKGAVISAYASPDGEYELNDKLSGKRQSSAARYLQRELKKAKVSQSDSEEFFSMMATAEDWEGFKEEMEKSDIADKELVLRVLSMYSEPDVREKEIRNIAEAFEEIKVEILPQLRRSKMSINVEVVGFSDEELMDLAKSQPDTLNKEEILYAATLFEGLADKEQVYKSATQQFPDCFRAKNNLGMVQFLQGNVSDAKSSFEAAKVLNDNDIVNNNLGAVALKGGDITKAESLLTSATGAGSAVNYNLGIIKIMQGEYGQANNYFGSKASFNSALAKLLNGEPDAALATLGQIDDVDAMDAYLKAVAGARSGKEEVVMNNLRTAVEKDATLKAYAKKDLEFRAFRANESFTAIVE